MTVMTEVDIVKSQILPGDLGVVQQLPILDNKRKFENRTTIYQLFYEIIDNSFGKKSKDDEIPRYLVVYGQDIGGNGAFWWLSHLFFTCVQSRKHDERLGNVLYCRFLNSEDMDVIKKILVFDPGGLSITHRQFDESNKINMEQFFIIAHYTNCIALLDGPL